MGKHGQFFRQQQPSRPVEQPAEQPAPKPAVVRYVAVRAVTCSRGLLAPGDAVPADAFDSKTKANDVARLLRLGVIKAVEDGGQEA